MTVLDLRGADVAIRGTVGTDVEVSITFTDSAGAAVNVSGYTAVADVLRNGTSVATFTDAVSGAGSNVLTLTLTDVQTTTIGNERTLTWRLSMTSGTVTEHWIAGEFRLYTAGHPQAGSGSSSATVSVSGSVSATIASLSVGLPLSTLDGRYLLDDGTNLTGSGAEVALDGRYVLATADAARFPEFRIVNQWYPTDLPIITAPATTPTYQRFRAAPFIVYRNSKFDRALVRVGTAGAAATFRIGIYDSAFNLVYDEPSTIDVSTTGAKELTLTTEVQLTPGVYWVGGTPQGTEAAALRMYGANSADAPINGQSQFAPITSFLSTGGFIGSNDTVSGAHPASLTTPSASTSGACVSVALRYSGTFT